MAGNKKQPETNQQDVVIAKIAREILGRETLETRNSESLDFSDQAVWLAFPHCPRAGGASGRVFDQSECHPAGQGRTLGHVVAPTALWRIAAGFSDSAIVRAKARPSEVSL